MGCFRFQEAKWAAMRIGPSKENIFTGDSLVLPC
jgi:hypothetical protein